MNINTYYRDIACFKSTQNKEQLEVFKAHAQYINAAEELARLYKSSFGLTYDLIEEYRALFTTYRNELPKVSNVTVYRGVVNTDGKNGISWSLSRDVAAKFGSNVIERQVAAHEVLCFIGGDEQEVVVDVLATHTNEAHYNDAPMIEIKSAGQKRYEFISCMISNGLISVEDALVKYADDIKEYQLAF